MESDRAKFAGKISKRPEQIWARPSASALPENAGCDALVQLGFRVLAKDKIYTRASYSHGTFSLNKCPEAHGHSFANFSPKVSSFPPVRVVP